MSQLRSIAAAKDYVADLKKAITNVEDEINQPPTTWS